MLDLFDIPSIVAMLPKGKMKLNLKSLIAAFAMVIVFSLMGNSLKAQYTYEIIDTTDGVTATYDSSTLISSDLSVTATTANSNFDLLTFSPMAILPAGPGEGGVDIVSAVTIPLTVTPNRFYGDILDVSTGTGQDNTYFFVLGTFETLGSFDSFIPQEFPFSPQAELIVSEVPEPSTWCLIAVGTIALLGWAARRRAFGIA